MDETKIRNSYTEHAALAQFHRWYQFYERSEAGIENALDILTPDVTIKSGLGEAKGHDAYAARVTKLPNTWKNAHFPKTTQIKQNDDGTLTLEATITYQNQGILPDGQTRNADLSYAMHLTPSVNDPLPKFSSIEITQNADSTGGKWNDAYAHNRAKSLVHYWLALVEDPKRNPAPFNELLAAPFKLNFASGAITTKGGFKKWLSGPASSVDASRHAIENFKVTAASDANFTIEMDFVWNGILPNGAQMTAKTHHTWIVVNDVTERFARIQTMDVETLEPFKVVE